MQAALLRSRSLPLLNTAFHFLGSRHSSDTIGPSVPNSTGQLHSGQPRPPASNLPPWGKSQAIFVGVQGRCFLLAEALSNAPSQRRSFAEPCSPRRQLLLVGARRVGDTAGGAVCRVPGTVAFVTTWYRLPPAGRAVLRSQTEMPG